MELKCHIVLVLVNIQGDQYSRYKDIATVIIQWICHYKRDIYNETKKFSNTSYIYVYFFTEINIKIKHNKICLQLMR